MSTSAMSQPGSMARWKDVPTRSVDVGGATFVYRELGPIIVHPPPRDIIISTQFAGIDPLLV